MQDKQVKKDEIIAIFERALDQDRYCFKIERNSKYLKDFSEAELQSLVESKVIKQHGIQFPTFELEQPYLNRYLEKKWEQLEDVPFKEVDNEQILDGEYWTFEKGYSTNEDIWHYFDVMHSKGIRYLLYNDYMNEQKISHDEDRLIAIFEKEYFEDKTSNGFIPVNSSLISEWSLFDFDILVHKNILQVRECQGLAYELTDEYISKLENEEENEI